MPTGLTPKQLQVLALVDHYHDALDEPTPAAYVARKLGITHERVRAYFRALSELGWLRGPASPAIPTRALPAHGGLEKIQLSETEAGGHAPGVLKRSSAGKVPSTPHTVEMPPLSIMAEVRTEGADAEARTVDVVFSTGAPVQRYDWMRDAYYLESLSLDPKHVRLKRLNNSAPLLDSHSSYRVANVLGVVVPKSAEVADGKGTATVRFSKRVDVEPVWQDVRDGIIRNVSVGYRVHKYERTPTEDGKPELRHAIDWEPFEISAVPMGADDGAKIRGDKSIPTNRCQIVTRAAAQPQATPPKKEPNMDEDTRSETLVEDDPLDPGEQRTTETPEEPNERDAGIKVERVRAQGILLACRAARLPQSFADKLINEGIALVDAQSRVFQELQKRDGNMPNPGSRGRAEVTGDDPLLHTRAGIEEALLHRVRPKEASDPKGFELTDVGRPYRGMTLLRIAEAYLNKAGFRTTHLSKMQLAALALGLETRTAGMHTTSDFANLLADVANKTLRRAYEEAPQTWAPISRRTTLPDFKPVKRLQIGEAPALLEVGDHGEFTFGTIGEGKEQFQLATYGRRFAITRKALVNDDTDAFSRVPTLFGRAARHLESDLVWKQITDNAAMGDGVALFHATHANLSGSSDAISVAAIGAGRTAMRVQKGVDLVTLLNIFPLYLIVPAAKETIADQFVSQNLLASQSSSVNPFAGRLKVIAEPRLDAVSAVSWFLAADPTQIDIIEHAYLEGEEGPMVESRVGFEVDGLEVKCREDFAAKVIDYRGLWKNPGA